MGEPDYSLKQCPFCGGCATIGIGIDEGGEPTGDYMVMHSEEDVPLGKACPIATGDDGPLGVGDWCYDSIEEARQYWDAREDESL